VPPAWIRRLQPLWVLGVATAGLVLLLGLLGEDPRVALRALVAGSLGDRFALENTLVRLCPLLLVGLAVALAFRTGIWNIGAEGQLCVGALATTACATRLLPQAPAWLAIPLALVVGSGAGAGWAGIAAWLRTRRGVSEVLSTLLLNFIGALAIAWAVHGPLQEAQLTYPQSDALPTAARLPMLAGTRVHAGILLALLASPLVAFVLFRTRIGLRWRAVGLSPSAARYAGIPPEREAARVLMVSGAMAGLAGAIEVSGVTGRLFENLAAGYGFTAIAVALLGRLQPLAIVGAALFFAILATGSGAMQRVAGVPAVAVRVTEGLVILLSVGFALRGNGR